MKFGQSWKTNPILTEVKMNTKMNQIKIIQSYPNTYKCPLTSYADSAKSKP
jgi:hypothetical protein